MTRRRLTAALGLSVAVASAAALAFGAGRGPDPRAVPTSAEVAARTMSPFCPGLTIEECPSPQSADLRERIDEKIAAGATNAEVDRWLVENYGTTVLARPAGMWAGLVPKLALPLGLLAVALSASRWSRKPAGEVDLPPDPQASAEDPKAVKLMREDFRRYQEASQE